MKTTKMLLIYYVLLFAFSCTSTRLKSSWKDPEFQPSGQTFNKILAVALYKDEPTRRIIEDKMVTYMQGKGVASYNYSGVSLQKENEEAIREKLSKDGFDGAVTMRLVDVDKDVEYTPGTITTYPTYYRTFGGYYRTSWNYYSTPDRYTNTKTYSVETNVYNVKQNKLIWSGLTETTDPSNLAKMTDEIAKVIYKKMVEEGFITK